MQKKPEPKRISFWYRKNTIFIQLAGRKICGNTPIELHLTKYRTFREPRGALLFGDWFGFTFLRRPPMVLSLSYKIYILGFLRENDFINYFVFFLYSVCFLALIHSKFSSHKKKSWRTAQICCKFGGFGGLVMGVCIYLCFRFDPKGVCL